MGGRDQSERLVPINRNQWSQSAGTRRHGWHRHVSLVMLAFAMMAVIRHRANPPPPKKTKRRTTAKTKA
jgi:SRSO17 transposase